MARRGPRKRNPSKAYARAFAWHREHSGGAHPLTSTAGSYARIERRAKADGLSLVYEPDYGEPGSYVVFLVDETGKRLGPAVGGVDTDSRDYARTLLAQLAWEHYGGPTRKRARRNPYRVVWRHRSGRVLGQNMPTLASAREYAEAAARQGHRASIRRNPSSCDGCGRPLNPVEATRWSVCMDCTRARAATVARRGKCACRSKARAGDVVRTGSRSFVPCRRCLGTIRQLS